MPTTTKPKGIFNDDRDDRALARAINELTEWLKANHAAVTKRDLLATEGRLLDAIKAGGGVTPGIEAAYAKVQMALDGLDAQIPDR